MASSTAQVIKFRFGTTLIASDGEAGSLISVVVVPGQRQVSQIGVKLPGGTRVAVPLDRVVEANADSVQVSVTREALLQAMAPIPANATAFAPATRVSAGSRSGNLAQLTISAATGKLYRLGFRAGLGGEVLADANWITDISDSGNAVTLTLPAGAELLPYRADAEIADDAQHMLYNYNRLRIDLRAIQVRVVDGEAWLRGNVSSRLNQRVTAELLEGIKGLYTIHNELVADPDLALAVAEALSADPRTHGQPIGVYPTLGHIYLRGLAGTPEVVVAAATIARGISGQQEVVSQLAVSAQADHIPVLAPVTGTEDIIPGGD